MLCSTSFGGYFCNIEKRFKEIERHTIDNIFLFGAISQNIVLMNQYIH